MANANDIGTVVEILQILVEIERKAEERAAEILKEQERNRQHVKKHRNGTATTGGQSMT